MQINECQLCYVCCSIAEAKEKSEALDFKHDLTNGS